MCRRCAGRRTSPGFCRFCFSFSLTWCAFLRTTTHYVFCLLKIIRQTQKARVISPLFPFPPPGCLAARRNSNHSFLSFPPYPRTLPSTSSLSPSSCWPSWLLHALLRLRSTSSLRLVRSADGGSSSQPMTSRCFPRGSVLQFPIRGPYAIPGWVSSALPVVVTLSHSTLATSDLLAHLRCSHPSADCDASRPSHSLA